MNHIVIMDLIKTTFERSRLRLDVTALIFLFSDLFFRALTPSSFLSLLPSPQACSGLHRGECVWDGVDLGLTGKETFSLASKTSSRLLRALLTAMK